MTTECPLGLSKEGDGVHRDACNSSINIMGSHLFNLTYYFVSQIGLLFAYIRRDDRSHSSNGKVWHSMDNTYKQLELVCYLWGYIPLMFKDINTIIALSLSKGMLVGLVNLTNMTTLCLSCLLGEGG